MIFEYIKSDLYRYTGRWSWRLFFKNLLKNRSFKFSFWYRVCQTKNPIIKPFAKIIFKRLTYKYSIQIPKETKIGYGLYIGHHMCIVVNSTAVIGNNCNLSQFTTIGSNDGKAATIGDNVYIGPSVCIVEDVLIGDNSTIGAGSVVTRDVLQDTTVAGSPAKLISTKQPGRYITNRWPL